MHGGLFCPGGQILLIYDQTACICLLLPKERKEFYFVEDCVIRVKIYFPKLTRYPRRARSALGVDTVLTLDVCLYVSALERKRLIGMT